MPALSCRWQTVADWVIETGELAAVFANAVAQGGDAYTRVCADGTVWIEETLALTLAGDLP